MEVSFKKFETNLRSKISVWSVKLKVSSFDNVAMTSIRNICFEFRVTIGKVDERRICEGKNISANPWNLSLEFLLSQSY